MRLLETNRFNTNADISYTPIYPGVYTNLNSSQNNDYRSIELLGNSRNIDDIIKRVNPTPDPYFTIEDIKNNHVFGRVYEEYNVDMDKTF
jgi:hypothetical protein